jgi:hypothetical protein
MRLSLARKFSGAEKSLRAASSSNNKVGLVFLQEVKKQAAQFRNA